jgi:hypothetical protein
LNEIRRHQFASQLSAIPLPAYGEIVATGSQFGNIGSNNGDMCSYQAIVVVKAWLSDVEALQFLQRVAGMTFEPAVSGGLIRPQAKITRTYGHFFTIILEDGPYEPNLDPRCW